MQIQAVGSRRDAGERAGVAAALAYLAMAPTNRIVLYSSSLRASSGSMMGTPSRIG
jgi:hypothetical protein